MQASMRATIQVPFMPQRLFRTFRYQSLQSLEYRAVLMSGHLSTIAYCSLPTKTSLYHFPNKDCLKGAIRIWEIGYNVAWDLVVKCFNNPLLQFMHTMASLVGLVAAYKELDKEGDQIRHVEWHVFIVLWGLSSTRLRQRSFLSLQATSGP